MATLFLYHFLRFDADRSDVYFAAARVLDAVVSPLMGFLTDNFGDLAR
jgi:Na+/melibiose symporter-like transporter